MFVLPFVKYEQPAGRPGWVGGLPTEGAGVNTAPLVCPTHVPVSFAVPDVYWLMVITVEPEMLMKVTGTPVPV